MITRMRFQRSSCRSCQSIRGRVGSSLLKNPGITFLPFVGLILRQHHTGRKGEPEDLFFAVFQPEKHRNRRFGSGQA